MELNLESLKRFHPSLASLGFPAPRLAAGPPAPWRRSTGWDLAERQWGWAPKKPGQPP